MRAETHRRTAADLGPAFDGRGPCAGEATAMIRRLFLKLFRRRRMLKDLEAGRAFHREMSAAAGNPIPFGNAGLIKEQAFDLWRFNAIENFWRDLVYAACALRRSPGFVVTA